MEADAPEAVGDEDGRAADHGRERSWRELDDELAAERGDLPAHGLVGVRVLDADNDGVAPLAQRPQRGNGTNVAHRENDRVRPREPARARHRPLPKLCSPVSYGRPGRRRRSTFVAGPGGLTRPA